MVKDGGALARATSIGPRAATGLEVSADAAGGIPRYGITRRGGNNDRLSTLWRELIFVAGVARSSSKNIVGSAGACHCSRRIVALGCAITLRVGSNATYWADWIPNGDGCRPGRVRSRHARGVHYRAGAPRRLHLARLTRSVSVNLQTGKAGRKQ